MSAVQSFTLIFKNRFLEEEFLQATADRMRHQGRVAIVVGTLIYLMLGLLDPWLVSEEHMTDMWVIRLTALSVPAIVFALSYTELFVRWGALMLATVGLAAGVGVIVMQTLMPVETSALFYPALVLATFFTYNFIGTRFIYALIVDMALLIAYNGIFGVYLGYPLHLMLNHDFFIISANLIGGFAGYLSEHQRRILFLRERQLDEERKLHLERSLHDELTGLPNRELLYDRIAQALHQAQRDNMRHCGIFLDLDGFKQVNDRLGHKVGDNVLWQVADRMRATVRSMDTVARIGGDEFFILALDIGNENGATKITRKILDSLSMPIRGLPDDMVISASAGICLFPFEGMTTDELIHRADEGMYQVKRTGKGGFTVVS